MWRREMDCLLFVCDYIVECFPYKEILPDGTIREVRIQAAPVLEPLMLFWKTKTHFDFVR